jgi:GDP-L-fucose synthase
LVVKSHSELDLLNQNDVNDFFEKEKPDVVILCAAKV